MKLNKWGNSWAIRLPSAYLKELGIDDYEIVDINLEKDQITIKKTSSVYHGKYSLDELLNGIDTNNLPNESWADSTSLGQEQW